MRVKIDTKEAFHVICIEESVISANMSEELEALINAKQQEDPKSVIINLKKVVSIEPNFAKDLEALHNTHYKEKKSFVLCELQAGVKKQLEELGSLEQLNHTPTESEAWDIVQMEEIERELDLDN